MGRNGSISRENWTRNGNVEEKERNFNSSAVKNVAECQTKARKRFNHQKANFCLFCGFCTANAFHRRLVIIGAPIHSCIVAHWKWFTLVFVLSLLCRLLYNNVRYIFSSSFFPRKTANDVTGLEMWKSKSTCTKVHLLLLLATWRHRWARQGV